MRVFFVFGLVFVLLLGGLFTMASVSSSYATARQAQAAIEASRATQVVAMSNLVLTVVLVLVVALVGVGVVAWSRYALRLRATSSAQGYSTIGAPAQGGQWLPGPNAGWGKQAPALSAPGQVDPQTVLLMALAYRLMQPAPSGQVALLAEPADDDEDWSDVWQGFS